MGDRPEIDRAQIEYLAGLAHLTLDEDEKQSLVGDLNNIVAYVDILSFLDTSNVRPTFSGVELLPAHRVDVAKPGLSIEDALRAAPERVGDAFAVPEDSP